jgi:hypothetical protein
VHSSVPFCIDFRLFTCVQICPVEPLITEHMISMATISNTTTKHKLLSVQGKLDIINMVDVS